MSAELPVLISGFIVGFYMAWNIGANDAANSMASAVGAKAVTLRQAILIAGMGNIIGATFIGAHVTDTIRKGIVSPDILGDPHLAILGAFAALFSAVLWVAFATWKSLPVSTTHSIVGAMAGFGIAAGGFQAVQWGGFAVIVLGWVIFPVFSLVIGFLIFKLIVRLILSRAESFRAALKLSPFFIGMAVFVCLMSFLLNDSLGKAAHLSNFMALFTSLIISAGLGFAGRHAIIRLTKSSPDNDADGVFRRIQIGASFYVALAQGANDAANAAGPLAVIYFLFKTGTFCTAAPAPVFLLLFGGIGIACGIAMGGARGIQTVGEKITTLRNARGVAVDFSAATTVLVASKLGLPVSTAHAAIGGVMGVGLARGFEAVNFRIVFQMMLYWALTLPVTALTCMAIFKILAFFIN
ncbi:MAG: inorganic phosphate transporter [Desulfobacteraceae bacterium]|nr:inorganic phosphate transporter [Desulfobacteraceae bacterium]